MAALPSVSDLVTTVFLLLPGFISLNLIRYLGKLEFTLSDLETTIWSLAGSLAIDTLFTEILLASKMTVSTLQDLQVALLVPKYGGLFLVLALLGGIVPGLALRYILRRGVFTGALWDTVYSLSRISKKSIWIIVYSSDKEEFQGKLIGMSKGKNIAHEVLIGDPQQIVRDASGEIRGTIDLGSELYFKEDDIKRIVFSEPLFAKEDPTGVREDGRESLSHRGGKSLTEAQKQSRIAHAYLIPLGGGFLFIGIAIVYALAGLSDGVWVSVSTVVAFWILSVSVYYEYAHMKVVQDSLNERLNEILDKLNQLGASISPASP